jgi:ribose 1,5-bisphosphokinase PhnN
MIGPPGVGKSTIMSKMLLDWSSSPPVRLGRDTIGHYLINGTSAGVYLGRIDAHRPGTDTMIDTGYQANLEWVDQLPADIILGEGARLGTPSFLLALHQRTDLSIIHLTAPPSVTAHRRRLRPATDNPRWVSPLTTRLSQTIAACSAGGCDITTISTDRPLDHTVRMVLGVTEHHNQWAYLEPDAGNLYEPTDPRWDAA